MEQAVFEEMYPKIYNYVYYRVLHREDAQDITSEVFCRAVACAGSFDPRRAFYSTWLFAIAGNCVLKYWRDRKNVISFEEFAGATELASDAAPHDETIILDEETQRLHELLQTLPERDREILALRFWGELSYKEIAAQTGLSVTNVGVILKRATEKLRTLW